MTETQTLKNDPIIEAMFKAGAHFAYSRSRRHPSAEPYIFGAKNRVEIFDLEKTKECLDKAKAFATSVAVANGQLLFVSGKNEALEAIKVGAESIGMPFVAGRWIGGTITNFAKIRSRVEKLNDLLSQKEKGELQKYTKKERLLIDKDIADLEKNFGGISPMKELPKAVFVVDSRKEHTVVAEAKKAGIPVISLSGSDCDMKETQFPIPANDSSMASIKYFVGEIVNAYKSAKKV